MKFSFILVFLFSITTLQANDLSVQVNFGFCSSVGSGQAMVIATGGVEPYAYAWSDPSLTGDQVFDLGSGTYTVTTTDATGCEVIETFEIPDNSDVSVNYFVLDIICFGEMNGQIIIEDFFPSYLLFSLDGVSFSDVTTFENLDAGLYTLFILETNGCITQKDIFVNQAIQLLTDLGEDIEIQLGDSVELVPLVSAPFMNLTFHWSSTSEILNCTDCFEQWVNPFETTTYTFTIQDANGCTASDQVTIFINDDKNLFIPNVFTPNFDGVNDIFTVYGGVGIKQIERFSIRDDFGNIVYEAHNFPPNNFGSGWDGRFEGRRMDMGVFLYLVRVEYFDGTFEDIFGTVTLVY